jgi:hypothetical protein
MSRTYRALTTLALSLALVGTTAAVASAAEDVNDSRKALYESELAQNLKAGAAASTQAAEQARAGEREFAAAAGAAEDVNAARKALYQSELAHNQAAAAARTQAAAEQARAGERNLVPVVTITAPQPVPLAPGRDVDLIAIALLGLVGGLIGGAAVVAGAAANRRRHRVVAA